MMITDFFPTQDDLAYYLDKNKPTSIGGFSKVYSVGEYILKVTQDESYLEFIKLIKELKVMCISIESFPLIYDHIEVGGFHYILMEKLERSPHWCFDEACVGGYWEADPCVWYLLEDDTLNEALSLLEDRFNYTDIEVGWDLRDTNIMQRKDGTLVITDPWKPSGY